MVSDEYISYVHVYTTVSGKLIVSRYVAESITTDAGRFGHVGLCQLRTITKNTVLERLMAYHTCVRTYSTSVSVLHLFWPA